MKNPKSIFFMSILILTLFATLFSHHSFSATVRDMARQRVQSGEANSAAPAPGAQTNNPQPLPDSMYRTRIRQPQGAYRGRQYSGASAREVTEQTRRYNTRIRRQSVPPAAGTSSSLQKYKVVQAPVGVMELETLLNQAASRGYSLVTTLGSKLIFVRQ